MNSLEQMRFLVRYANELELNGITNPEQRVAAQHRLNTAIWEQKREEKELVDRVAAEVIKRLTVMLDKTAIDELRRAIDSLGK